MTQHVAQHIQQAILNAQSFTTPFRHWLLSDILPADLAKQCLNTPMQDDPEVRYDGTRAGNSQNTSGGRPPERLFLTAENCGRFPYFQDIIDACLTKTLCRTLHNLGVVVENRYLRIEYIVDRSGFFLEPHLDIGEKELTFQIYLGDAPGHCGTDLYDAEHRHAKGLTFQHNHGYIFIPGQDTWHGLEKKDIPHDRPRCSMIVNYVTFATDWPVPWTHAALAAPVATAAITE